jgi:hypothetical protein
MSRLFSYLEKDFHRYHHILLQKKNERKKRKSNPTKNKIKTEENKKKYLSKIFRKTFITSW